MRDVLVSALVCGLVLFIFDRLTLKSGDVQWLVHGFAILLVLAGVGIVSLVRGRPAYLLGLLLLFVMAPIVAIWNLWLNTWTAERQVFWDLAAPLTAPQTIALERGYDPCNEICMALLVQRNDTIIWRGNRTFRLEKHLGRACRTSVVAANLARNGDAYQTIRGSSDFLRRGIMDACWFATRLETEPDAFVLRRGRIEQHSRHRNRTYEGIANGAFHGDVFELIKSVDGVETVIGRRLQGRIGTHVTTILLGPSYLLGGGSHLSRNVGSRETAAEFLSDAVGIDTSIQAHLSPAELDAVLSEFWPLLDLTGEHRDFLLKQFGSLIGDYGLAGAKVTLPYVLRLLRQPDNTAQRYGVDWLRAYLQPGDDRGVSPAIDQLLRSDVTDDRIFGLLRLHHAYTHPLSQNHRDAILVALRDTHPDVVLAALIALRGTERRFAQTTLLELALGTYLQEHGDGFLRPLIRVIGEPIEAGPLARAREIMLDPEHSEVRRLAAFAVMMRGTDRITAVKEVAALPAGDLVKFVGAIDAFGWYSLGGSSTSPDFTRAEVDLLTARFADIPLADLGTYANILRPISDALFRRQLGGEVAARMDRIERSAHPNPEDLAILNDIKDAYRLD